MYVRSRKGVKSYLLLYVDDIFLASSSEIKIDNIKLALDSEFDMEELGSAKRILGIDIVIKKKTKELFLTQSSYVSKVLHRFNMSEYKVVLTHLVQHINLSREQYQVSKEDRIEVEKEPYSSGVGSIMYSMVFNRPDLTFAIPVVMRYMENPGKAH